MKQRRTFTLIFQLVLSYAIMLAVLLALVVISWNIIKSETQNSSAITALTAPYTRILTGISRLRNTRSGVLGTDGGEDSASQSEALLSDMERAAQELVARLNEDGYSRSSVDVSNILERYREAYEDILASYAAHDYPQVNRDIMKLDQVESWLQRDLVALSTDIAERQERMRERSGEARSAYYRVVLVAGIGIFLFSAMVLTLGVRRFAAPIEALCRNVRQFRLSDDPEALKARGIPCRPDSVQEVRTLATAIYSMESTVLGQYAVEKHNEQLQQKLASEAMRTAQMERRLQEARLKALQAQINPHFLYNTLNMIGQMSYIEGAERTTELIETFSDFFRYNVENFERDVTLRDEIACAKGYAALQKERFGDRIRYVFEADDAINELRVPSLIVQPLVENAVSHGLRMRTEGGEVRVAVKAVDGGGFEIAVSDNGCGMDAQALRALRERAEETRGDDQAEHVSIGITNVISRMRLTFGHRFSYDIQSAPEQGFSVRLRVEGE